MFDKMKPLISLILFLFMSCATIPKECMELRVMADEKYFTKIDGINFAQSGKGKVYYVMTLKAMQEMNERYDALANYVNCVEGE